MVARGPDSLGTQWHRDQVAQGMGTHQHGPSWDTSPRCQPGATQQWQCHQATCAGPTYLPKTGSTVLGTYWSRWPSVFAPSETRT